MRVLRDVIVKTDDGETSTLTGGTIVMLLGIVIDVRTGKEYADVYVPTSKKRYIVSQEVMVNI